MVLVFQGASSAYPSSHQVLAFDLLKGKLKNRDGVGLKYDIVKSLLRVQNLRISENSGTLAASKMQHTGR